MHPDATTFYVNTKARAAVSQLEMARSRVAHARTPMDLVRILNGVHVDHLVKNLSPVREEQSRLTSAAQRKAEELVDALIGEAGSLENRDQLLRRLHDALLACRGHFPREVRRIQDAQRRRASSST